MCMYKCMYMCMYEHGHPKAPPSTGQSDDTRKHGVCAHAGQGGDGEVDETETKSWLQRSDDACTSAQRDRLDGQIADGDAALAFYANEERILHPAVDAEGTPWVFPNQFRWR